MAAESDVLSEIEVLQSIYLDELNVTQNDEGGWTVSLVLHPSTAEDCLSQFVRLTLTMDLDSQYPYSSPYISIHNPRGLSDDKLLSLQKSLQMEAEECVGTPVLYQLIERAKEILTDSNIPHGNCVICLYDFKEGEVFTKTSCYHYFHSHCLGRYITHSEMELKDRERELEEDKTRDRTEEEELAVVCPVCRESLTYDLDALLSSPAPVLCQQEDAVIGGEFKKKWEALQKILERQKEKGGVIDPEAESNRFLIHINEAPVNLSDTPGMTDSSGAESTQSLPSSSPDSTSTIQTSQNQHTAGQPQRKHTGDFKRGRRGRGAGRGGPARHMVPAPGGERLGKHIQSSDKINSANSGPTNTTSQVESTAQRQACELSENTAQLRQPLTNEENKPVSQDMLTSGPKDGQEVSQQKECISKEVTQTILQEGHPEREHVGRGDKRGSRGSARHHGHWQDRNYKGPGHWDNSGSAGHRGGAYRTREGGAGRGHRGGGAYRGGGRGMHQRVEKEFRKEGVL
ncbi:E3 ubiquitin-protein ligase RNF25 [Danio rerio]|uniref:E3 ubiquitin-protein ligase RNF25 n=1 Tax=Danio rerio TaxID=7955 RepID=UPI00001B6313|nr:E3 ubiquitin-protein ligase RNF25 [Danio rerio]AAH55571.1 Zgc:66260 [Danio rerio]|eukprot:NP_957477.1 E3 ubiquitin-protein ligase RNF25 [Danio rerio]